MKNLLKTTVKLVVMSLTLALHTSYVSAGVFRVQPRLIRLPSTPKPSPTKPKITNTQSSNVTPSDATKSNPVVPYIVGGAVIMENQKASSNPKPEYVKKK